MGKIYLVAVLCAIKYGILAQVNLNSSLTACYSLDGNASDAINSLTGTLSAITPTVNRFNSANSAMYFPGTVSGFIVLPEDPLLKPANEISISVWVKQNITGNGYILFTKNSMNSYFEAYDLCVYNHNNTGFRFMTRKCGPLGQNMVLSTMTVNPNTWYHLVATITNSVVRLYINGVLDGSTPATYNGFDYVTGKKVYLGGSNEAGFNNPFHGTMDNARFYNRAINASEVAALYSQDPACLAAGQPPVASFTTNTQTVCVGAAVSFTDASTNSPTSWSWTLSGPTASVSSIANPVFAFSSPGIHTVSLVSSNTVGASNNVTMALMVNPNPTIFVSVVGSSQTTFCKSDIINIQATGAQTYTWSNLLTGPSFGLVVNNNATFTVTGTNINGCKSSASISIQVAICEGLNENAARSEVLVYPNPVRDKLYLQNISAKRRQVAIRDLTGKLLFETVLIYNDPVILEMENYAPGFYFISVTTDSDNWNEKLLVE